MSRSLLHNVSTSEVRALRGDPWNELAAMGDKNQAIGWHRPLDANESTSQIIYNSEMGMDPKCLIHICCYNAYATWTCSLAANSVG